MNAMVTPYALRMMADWVRLADAMLHEGALDNAAGAVRDKKQSVAREAAELAAVDLRAAVTVAG